MRNKEKNPMAPFPRSEREEMEEIMMRRISKMQILIAELARYFNQFGQVMAAWRATTLWEARHIKEQRGAEVEWRANAGRIAGRLPLFYVSSINLKRQSAGMYLKHLGLSHRKNTGIVYNFDQWVLAHNLLRFGNNNPAIHVSHHHRDGRAYRATAHRWDGRGETRIPSVELVCPSCNEYISEAARFHYDLLRITDRII